jgi:hypothetical protein
LFLNDGDEPTVKIGQRKGLQINPKERIKDYNEKVLITRQKIAAQV